MAYADTAGCLRATILRDFGDPAAREPCGAGLVHVPNDQYQTLSLTPLGRDVMAGRVEDVQMAIPTRRSMRASRRRKPWRMGWA